MKRVPAVTAALARTKGWEERLEGAVQQLRDRGVAVDEKELHDLRAPAGLARLQQNATVKALFADTPVLRHLLDAATVELGVAPAGTSFIIGSHPIAGVRSGLQAAANLSTDMWFPVASDVAVNLVFGGAPHTLPPEKVALINRDSRDQSEYVAGASKELVEAVTASSA